MRSTALIAIFSLLFAASPLAAPVISGVSSLEGRKEPGTESRPRPHRPKFRVTKIRGGKGNDFLNAIEDTVQRFLEANAEDKDIQSARVQEMVTDLSKKPENKGKNILIFHDQSSEVKLKNSAHYHVEINKLVGGTKGYEIMIFDEGEFTLHGDAGWLNWGIYGCWKRDGPEGKHVIFSKCS